MKRELLYKEADELLKSGKTQVLLDSDVEENKGKKVVCLWGDYYGHTQATEFVMGSLMSQWDYAKNDTTAPDNFANRQEYWKSFYNEEQIQEAKDKILLLDIDGNYTFIYSYGGKFYCGDDGRVVSFYLPLQVKLEFYKEVAEHSENDECEVLTIDKAKELKGKEIVAFYYGESYNSLEGFDGLVASRIIVGDIIEMKNCKKKEFELLSGNGERTYFTYQPDECPNGEFFCSDSDRYVYFYEENQML